MITATSSSSTAPWAAAVAWATIVAVPIAVGVYARGRRPYRRFGLMLIVMGAGWSLAALAESNDGVLYSAGRVSAWIVEVGFVWVILAFPSGSLTGRWARVLVTALAVLLLVVYLPTALLADGYPTPSPWTECQSGCPANAFQLVTSEPGFVADGLRGVRETLSIVAYVGVIALLAARLRSAATATRLMLVPIVIVATTRFAATGSGSAYGRRTPARSCCRTCWTSTLLLPALAAAFLIGLLRWEVFSAHALERLSRSLHHHPDVDRLRTAMIETLGDPKLDLAFWNPEGRWIDAQGRPLHLAAIDDGRTVTTIRDDGVPTVAIIHDAALDAHPEFLEAAGNYAGLALSNHQLLEQIEASLREIQESRARILASADAERRRIERDLHDGAQQRLVALRIKLELVRRRCRRTPAAARAAARDRRRDGRGARGRALAGPRRYPALLRNAGSPRLFATPSSTPRFRSRSRDRLSRYPAEVESGVYFCCLEAVQNVVKHAPSASTVRSR